MNNNNKICFRARNPEIKTVDTICRNINKEFPVYSNTKISAFMPHVHKKCAEKMINYTGDLVSVFREYYSCGVTKQQQILKMLSGMKKARIGNCGELAETTSIALNANGYKNVRVCELYAVNKHTKEIRDLDHSVSIINLKIPDRYQYCDSNKQNVEGKYLLKPDNKTILVDSWAGFADYCKSALTRYKSDIPLSDRLPDNNESIMLLPSKKNKLNKYDLQYITETYPNMSLNKGVDSHRSTLNQDRFQIVEFPDSEIADLKKNHHMKKAEFGLQNNKDNNQSFWRRLINFFT